MVEASLPFQHYRHSPYHARPQIASIVVLFLGTLLLFDSFRLSSAAGRRIGTGASGGPSLHAPTVNLNRKRLPQRNSSLDVSKSEIFFGPRRAYLLLLLPPQCFQTTTVAPTTSKWILR